MATQDNWRFCTKCYSLFWYGDLQTVPFAFLINE